MMVDIGVLKVKNGKTYLISENIATGLGMFFVRLPT